MPLDRQLLIISGPSSVGKNTLITHLVSKNDISFIVPYTSRPKRDDEVAGRDYHFRSRRSVQKGIVNGEFSHWDFTLGNYYGFDNKLSTSHGLTHALARMAVRIRQHIDNVTLVFLKPADVEIHFNRLEGRFPNNREFKARISHFEEEVSHASMFDHVLTVTGATEATNAQHKTFWKDFGLKC